MMKRFFRLLPAVLVCASILCAALPVRAETNLIANPGAETANGAQPANWTSNAWGTNTASFAYDTTAHSGSHSLKVTLSSYTDGDAKWIHDQATISPNISYTFSDWYRSSVASEIVFQYSDASNNLSYAYGQAVPASANWQQTALTFTTPASATKVSVFHLIAQVGWLQTDDYSLSTTTLPPPATDGNLISNPSFETANGSLPAGWNTGKWGANNATFTYATTGRTGSRSAQVTMSSYTDGDAKWYSSAVPVTAGKTYTYSDYYIANAQTPVIVAYGMSNGSTQYAELSTAPVASAWTAYSQNLTVPTGATSATIYHLLASVGNLTIDDVSLTTQVLPPTSGITIPNASVEQGTTTPTSWSTDGWGSNTRKFQYITTEGHNSAKSVKVTVSNYKDGDAKWMFNPIKLDTGKQYRFTTWYKGNVAPKAASMFVMADGTERYFGMPDAQPGTDAATTWQKYSDTFSVPAGATKVSVFLFVNKNGWLQTDDYSLDNYTPVGFSSPLLTLTFDDGHEDNAATALPLLTQYGFKSTQCFATSFIEGQPQAALDKVLAFSRNGHEICSHSVTHPFMTTLNDTNLDYEAKHSKEYLEKLIGQPVNDFATPYGDYDARVNATLKKYYQAHRTVDEGYNSKDNFDPYRLRVQNILKTTTASEVTAWVNQAKADKTWLILVYHRVANDPEEFDTPLSVFPSHLEAIKNSGITVKTFKDALADTKAQL